MVASVTTARRQEGKAGLAGFSGKNAITTVRQGGNMAAQEYKEALLAVFPGYSGADDDQAQLRNERYV